MPSFSGGFCLILKQFSYSCLEVKLSAAGTPCASSCFVFLLVFLKISFPPEVIRCDSQDVKVQLLIIKTPEQQQQQQQQPQQQQQ